MMNQIKYTGLRQGINIYSLCKLFKLPQSSLKFTTNIDEIAHTQYMYVFVGKELLTINFPAPAITSCIFGGKNLDELYVTSMSRKLTEEKKAECPSHGSVFKVTGLGVKGYPPTVYEGPC